MHNGAQDVNADELQQLKEVVRHLIGSVVQLEEWRVRVDAVLADACTPTGAASSSPDRKRQQNTNDDAPTEHSNTRELVDAACASLACEVKVLEARVEAARSRECALRQQYNRIVRHHSGIVDGPL